MRETQIWEEVDWSSPVQAGPSVCADAFRNASNTLEKTSPWYILYAAARATAPSAELNSWDQACHHHPCPSNPRPVLPGQ